MLLILITKQKIRKMHYYCSSQLSTFVLQFFKFILFSLQLFTFLEFFPLFDPAIEIPIIIAMAAIIIIIVASGDASALPKIYIAASIPTISQPIF